MSGEKKCIVIGGGGFIGTELVRQLARTGRSITVIGRRAPRHVTLPQTCSYLQGDFGDPDVLKNCLQPGCEVVALASATVPATSANDPAYEAQANLLPTIRLFQAAVAHQVGRLLLISSGGTVYGDSDGLPISETHAKNPLSPYGITKLAIEQFGLFFLRSAGLPLVIARPSNAYGAFQPNTREQGIIPALFDAALNRRVITLYGAADSVRDYVAVTDLAGALVGLLEKGEFGEAYNVGTSCGTSNQTLLDTINAMVADDGFRVEAEIKARRAFDVGTNILNSQKLRDVTGWCPDVSLESGLREVWNARKTLADPNKPCC